MNNKKIQRNRMITYFVEAAHSIIEEKGIEEVTIRNVANLAGYNSATLYNYFKDLDHLVYFACMKYLRNYTLGLTEIESLYKDSRERFIAIWKFFCKHSFENPNIFYNIFFNKYSNKLEGTLKEYYEIFPGDIGNHSIDVSSMLRGETLLERNKSIIKPMVKDGYINQNELDTINEIIIYTYQSVLTRKIVEKIQLENKALTDKIISYINFIIK